jgi:INO80 complex subunit C
LPWPEDAVHFGSIDAPTSFLPAKKYSDISGLEAKYTDPQTRMNYAAAEEFKVIRCS